jgi:hypothetical protein
MTGFFNTMTAPQQEEAVATGNEETPSEVQSPARDRIFKPTDMPMGRIMAAVMRSAAKVQGQEQAKTVVNQQQSANSKLSVTMTANPDGGPPLVNVKNAPADLLNGTQQADAQAAYNTPREQVEKKLSGGTESAAPSAPVTAPPAEHPLEQAAAALEASGVAVVRPWSDEIKNAVTSEAALAAVGERLGIPDARKHAHQAWKQIESGRVGKAAVVQRLANMAAGQIEQRSHDLQATLSPYEEKKQQEQARIDHERTQKRLEQQLSDTEREKVLSHKQAIIKDTDFSLVDPSKIRAELDAQNVSGVPFTEFEYRRAEQKAKQDVAKAFEDFTSNREKYALGDYGTWQEAKAAFGHTLTESQDKQGAARWDAARRYTLSLRQRDQTQEELRHARLEAIALRIENASASKPATIGRADLNLMSVDELTAVDPATVKGYDSLLRQKEDLLRKELLDAKDEQNKAKMQAKAIEGKAARQFGDEEQYAGFKADLQKANRKIEEANAGLRAIQAKRSERGGAAPAQQPQANTNKAPKVGDKKTFATGPFAGKTGVWNGSSYVVPR